MSAQKYVDQLAVRHIPLADIAVLPNRLRQVDDADAQMLAESIKEVGLRSPITVRPDELNRGKYVLLTGAHRLRAYELANWTAIPSFVREGINEERAELEEIAENLHRRDLDELEHSEQLARWVEIVSSDDKSYRDDANTPAAKANEAAALAPSSPSSNKGGKGNKGGINEAARSLPGVTRTGAQRAVKIAGLTKEAKAAAKKLGLSDNQKVLLATAKIDGAEAQVEHLNSIVTEKNKAKEAAKAAKDKAATLTPVELHQQKARNIITKGYEALSEKVEAKLLVKEDIEYLIEQLQSLASRAGKSRPHAVKAIEAGKLNEAA